jgi:GTP cyclohydrolase II
LETGEDAMPHAAEQLPKALVRASVSIPFRLADGSSTPARAYAFEGLRDGREHVAFAFDAPQDPKIPEIPLVRLHSECLTGDVFGSERCDCGQQLHESLQRLTTDGGYLLYLRQEGRGIGLVNKLQAYALQDQGLDTFEANEALGLARDARDYAAAAQMLQALGVTEIRLISNNPEKADQLAHYGITIHERVPTGVFLTAANRRYLEAKAQAGGHRLALDDLSPAVAALLTDTRLLVHRLSTTDTPWPPAIAEALADMVIRPLTALLDDGTLAGLTADQVQPVDRSLTATSGDPVQADPIDAQLWRIASAATALRTRHGAPALLVEATAALQDLTCRLATSEEEAEARLRELAAIQADVPPGIQASAEGPYLVSGAVRLTDHLGVALATRPQMALCRCGASQTKPYCDGAHARVGFSGAKAADRVPDRRDTYPGQQVTVLDNRGICAHSGFCTDRLSTVFRLGQEPFVAPSGGRMDEIVRAVRACPSGALSFAVDGVEARDQVDVQREPAIEVSQGGPYRVTGSIPLTGADGGPEPRNAGASTEHYSLCRCGQSQNKPFCSGMHWYVDFQDPPMPAEPTLFQWLGGLPALTRMTRLFYEKHVPNDPLLAPIFAEMSPDHPERVAAWLGETFGGPATYSDTYGGYDRMVGQHAGKGLTEQQRARWAQLIVTSADEAGLPTDPEFRAAFVAYIEWGSRIALENSQPGAHPPPHMPVPRWWWVCNATPDARVSALAVAVEPEGPVIEMPAENEPISFEEHIKPLFRATDRQSMKFAFDLWSHEDVSRHAEAILHRLRQGSMPCDGAWPPERIEGYERWETAGKPA